MGAPGSLRTDPKVSPPPGGPGLFRAPNRRLGVELIALDHRGGGVWTAGGWVQSESDPAKRYHVSVAVEVDMFAEKRKVHILKYSCECNDFLYRGLDRPCKHVYALVDHIRPQLEAQASWREKIMLKNEERKKKLEKAFEEVLKAIMLKIYVGGEEFYCLPLSTDMLMSLWIRDGVANASIGFECVNDLDEGSAEKIERVVGKAAGFTVGGAEVEVYLIERVKPTQKRNPLKDKRDGQMASGGEEK